MIFGVLVGLKFPDICLTDEENPEKTSPRKLILTGKRARASCVTGAHATACSTAVDNYLILRVAFKNSAFLMDAYTPIMHVGLLRVALKRA